MPTQEITAKSKQQPMALERARRRVLFALRCVEECDMEDLEAWDDICAALSYALRDLDEVEREKSNVDIKLQDSRRP
jgi:hypothetical protein